MQLFDAASLRNEDLNQILSLLRTGGVIGFPTDTAYGLGADPFNESAVREIFTIKRRPEMRPILLLVNSVTMVESVARFNADAALLTERFWPGPLTLVLPALSTVPELVTAGTGTIGVRWSSAAFPNRLIDRLGQPITATSANLSGSPAAVTAQDVVAQFGERLKVVVDGGTLPARGGSTLLDLTQGTPTLLREGPVPYSDLSQVLKGNIR